ncbi:MAG: hypothetical protein HZB38_15045 [Planctomycetes bacterium]|nr:hypothetical protein [Planctomycetota bacterium]
MTDFRARMTCLLALGVVGPALADPPTIDGRNIPTDFAGGTLLAMQRFQTGFGDDADGGQFGFGSELDAMYATHDGTYLYLGITGNLQNNGNAWQIFIDTNGQGAGAQQLYTRDVFGTPAVGLQDSNAPVPADFGRPRYLAGRPDYCPGMDNTTFDAGFAPDFVLGFSGGSPLGSQTRNYYLVNWTTLDPVSGGLSHTNEVAGLMTSGDPTASGPSGTLGSFLATSSLGIKGAFDNANDLGVEGGNDLSTLADTATLGGEFAIPLSLLGNPTQVCVFAIVTGDNGYQSNQFLPTDDTSTLFGNIACTPTDWNTISGSQFACYTLGSQGCPQPGGTGNHCTADVNGDCLIDIADLALLLSAFGSQPGDGTYNPAADLAPPTGIDISDLTTLLSQFGDNCN